MQVGDIIVGEFQNRLWPGRIRSMEGGRCKVKYFKVTQEFPESASKLIPFRESQCDRMKSTSRGDKLHQAAIKMAIYEARKQPKQISKSPEKREKAHSRGDTEKQLLKEEEEEEREQQPSREQADKVKVHESEEEEARALREYPDLLAYLQDEDVPTLIKTWKANRSYLCVYYNTTKQADVRQWVEAGELVLLLFKQLLVEDYHNETVESRQATECKLKKLGLIITSGLIDNQDCLTHDLLTHTKECLKTLEANSKSHNEQRMLKKLREWAGKMKEQKETNLLDFDEMKKCQLYKLLDQ